MNQKIPHTQAPFIWFKDSILATLKAFVLCHGKTYAWAISCLITIGLIDICIPWLVGRSIDAVRDGQLDSFGLWKFFFLLTFMGLFMYVLRYLWRLILFGTSYRLSVNLRNYLYQRLSKLGPSFFMSYGTGDLMARATNDIDNIEMTVGEAVLAAFDGLLTFVLVISFMMIAIDWRLALISLIPFPLMTYIFKILGDRIHKAFSTALDRFSDLNDHTQQSLTGLKHMRVLGLQHVLLTDFNELSEKAREANTQVARIEALFDPLVLAALGFSTLLSLTMGSWLIANDELTLGQLTSFYLYLGFLIWPMFAFGWFLNLYHRGAAAHDRLHELIEQPDTLKDKGRQENVPNYDLHIQVQRFVYQANLPQVLKSLNLEIKQGQVLGVVGPTGSGKTTLLRLIQRHYELEFGSIKLGEHLIEEYPLNILRDVFAMVPQDPILFSDTLKANIALGVPNASDEAVMAIANLAELGPDIAQLPLGLQTLVGEKGVSLSGGQRQRIALARALMRNAAILCLDDTLSAVDAETERRLLHALSAQYGKRSLLVVAHRLSAVKDADMIIVLSHGEITERGNHKSLMAEKGWYAKMYAHQQLESDLE